MSIINYCVFNNSWKRAVMPWQICAVHPPSLTFRDFFVTEVKPKCDCHDVAEVFVGRTKESLDRVDLQLAVAEVTSMFGPYVKYTVEESLTDHEAVAESVSSRRNAFEVLMNSQRQLSLKKLPDLIDNPKTAKQRLMNSVIKFLGERNCQWRGSDEVSSVGSNFVTALTNTLWAIDGHHHVFGSQGVSIPSIFLQFVGYNCPEVSKHRKRQAANMSGSVLRSLSSHLFHCLQAGYWSRENWSLIKSFVEQLAQSLANYSDYLEKNLKKIKLNHCRTSPVREIADNILFQFLPLCDSASSSPSRLQLKLEKLPNYQDISIEEDCPTDFRSKYNFLQSLKTTGFSFPTALLTYTHGNNIGSLHFIWKVESYDESSFSNCQPVIERLKKDIPVYHTRQMRKEVFAVFGRLTPSLKTATARHIYRLLTGDASAASTLSEAEIDKRVQLYADMEDPDIVIDLRNLEKGKGSKFDKFWDECAKFLQEEVGLAVDERRHSQVTHIASALSVRDLREQVAARCPPDTPIPSRSWISLQFWPKSAHAKARFHYTGRFAVKYMVQARQFRKQHEDGHYAAAIFRYQREYAIMLRDKCLFVCMDDKHRLKVGEPNYPVAAVERGRRVLVSRNQYFEVADHDFTKFSLIPSVSFVVNIPEEISESWYDGQVLVGVKEGAYEPSSPLRHATELDAALSGLNLLEGKPVLFLYCDGGPDHRLTYLSVKLSLICLFLKNDLDFLCACRTAPYQSWRNPAERVMSNLNIGLQCVGLMRQQMSDANEAMIAQCNNLSQLHGVAKKSPDIISAVLDCIEPVKILLSMVFQRLEVHGKKFSMFSAASEDQLRSVWAELKGVDPSLEYDKVYRQSALKNLPALAAFLEHCCRSRRYAFSIKKCGDSECTLCKPVRMDLDTFSHVHHLPDPVAGEDGHYTAFKDVLGTETVEKCPSFQAKRGKRKTLPFSASVQHVKNVDTMVQCEECLMWRLLYSKHKLSKRERSALQEALDDVTYSCGTELQDLELSGSLAEVYVRDLRCYEPIERLYYSTGKYEEICIHCAAAEDLNTEEGSYPQCATCKASREPIMKRKWSFFKHYCGYAFLWFFIMK